MRTTIMEARISTRNTVMRERPSPLLISPKMEAFLIRRSNHQSWFWQIQNVERWGWKRVEERWSGWEGRSGGEERRRVSEWLSPTFSFPNRERKEELVMSPPPQLPHVISSPNNLWISLFRLLIKTTNEPILHSDFSLSFSLYTGWMANGALSFQLAISTRRLYTVNMSKRTS